LALKIQGEQMSATFQAAAKALSENPELLAKVTSAGSAEERQAHFRDAGVAVPTHADVNSHMSDVAGGSTTTDWIGAVAPAAASGAAAA
jgi:hypothetical protein